MATEQPPTIALISMLNNALVGTLAGFPLNHQRYQREVARSVLYGNGSDDPLLPPPSPATEAAGRFRRPMAGLDHLDAHDPVTVTKAKGVEIFELSDGTVTHHARVVETITDADGGTTKHYVPVDIVADASMTDSGDLAWSPRQSPPSGGDHSCGE